MKKKNSTQAESPESTDPVASQLGVARLRLGWTIEEASARTRLHLNVIRKLEAGDFDKFPSSAYARGFLKIYSRELGLDSKKILREFQPLHESDDSILDIRPEMLEALPTRASEPILTTRGIGLGVLGLVGLFVVSVLGIQIYRVWPVKSPKDPSTLAPIGAVEKTAPTAAETSATATSVKAGEPISSLPMVQNSDNSTPKASSPSNSASKQRKTPGFESSRFVMAKKSNCSKTPSTKMILFPPKMIPRGLARPLLSPPVKPLMPKSFSMTQILALTKNPAPKPFVCPPPASAPLAPLSSLWPLKSV